MSDYMLRGAVTPEVERELSEYSPLLRSLLSGRGIKTKEDALFFLNPDFSKTHDPFLMKDMRKAVERIKKAISGGEKIGIFSDYDADGIPGAVALHDFFKKIGYVNFINYIPDRHTEGFGLNEEAITRLKEEGVSLLITIDCGITDSSQVDIANELGIEVIITDHHLPSPAGLPKAYAILNPKQETCEYPEKMLCGSGVVFKLIQALCKEIHDSRFTIHDSATYVQGSEKWLLDMVGIATLSDMVPLTGENRLFGHFGLKVLQKSPRRGLNELYRILKIERRNVSEDDIGFSISPRINAASRMGVPMDAFRLFATDDSIEAREMAMHLDRINNERKGKVASLVKEARRVVKDRYEVSTLKVVVTGNPNWRPALLGLVASALVEDFQKPVFVWGKEGGVGLKGSCRSDGSVNLAELMHEAKQVFVDFGGHSEAGGFSTTLEKVHLLQEELERAYEKVRTIGAKKEDSMTDASLSLDDVNWDTWKEISRLAPFGVGNPKPLFKFHDVVPTGVSLFGKEKQHLKLIFKKTGGEKISAISFFTKMSDFGKEISSGKPLTLFAHMENSTFSGTPELRLRIVHIT